VPSTGVDRRWKSSRKQVEATDTNRKVTLARVALKEAGSEPASRRTGSGYEAEQPWASGQWTAKLKRPKRLRRKAADCAGKSTTPYLGRPRLVPERATLPMRSGARSQQRP